MTAKIEGNIIYLTRGDTFSARVELRDEEENEYTPQDGDLLRFALKRAKMLAGKIEFRDIRPVVLKTIPNATQIIQLMPEDTRRLPFGLYKYDVEFIAADGTVDTVINNEDFHLLAEVLNE